MTAWKRVALAAPGVGVSLLPKLACPVCWPAYAGLLTSLGLGVLISERYLFSFTAIFLIAGVGALLFRARERRGYGPAALGGLGALVILIGKFHFSSQAGMYSGLALFVLASLWNSWPARPQQSCPQCDPDGNEVIQLNRTESES
jgi:mercuric ion transport protein